MVEAQLAVAVAAYGKDVVVVAEEKSVVPATGDHYSLFSFDGRFFAEGCLHLDLQAGYGRRRYYFVSRLQAALPVIILAPCPGVTLAVYHGSVVLSRRQVLDILLLEESLRGLADRGELVSVG